MNTYNEDINIYTVWGFNNQTYEIKADSADDAIALWCSQTGKRSSDVKAIRKEV